MAKDFKTLAACLLHSMALLSPVASNYCIVRSTVAKHKLILQRAEDFASVFVAFAGDGCEITIVTIDSSSPFHMESIQSLLKQACWCFNLWGFVELRSISSANDPMVVVPSSFCVTERKLQVKTLYLIRHGEAAPWADSVLRDSGDSVEVASTACRTTNRTPSSGAQHPRKASDTKRQSAGAVRALREIQVEEKRSCPQPKSFGVSNGQSRLKLARLTSAGGHDGRLNAELQGVPTAGGSRQARTEGGLQGRCAKGTGVWVRYSSEGEQMEERPKFLALVS